MKNSAWKARDRWMTLKVTWGHRRCRYLNLTGRFNIILIRVEVCSENFSILHRFRDITTIIALYVTACDLEMSFRFYKTVEVTSHVRFLIYVQTYRDSSCEGAILLGVSACLGLCLMSTQLVILTSSTIFVDLLRFLVRNWTHGTPVLLSVVL